MIRIFTAWLLLVTQLALAVDSAPVINVRPTSPDEARQGEITAAGGQHVNLRNNAGTEIGTEASPAFVMQSRASTSTNTRPAVTNSSSTIIAANSARKWLYIMNNTGATVWLRFGASASVNEGITLLSGGTLIMGASELYTGAIHAIKNGGSVNLDVFEGT